MSATKSEILIIESRSADDIYHNRFEGRTLKDILELQGINSIVIEVTTKDYFFKALELLQKKYKNIKYVHISAHGDESGLTLTNEETITWKEFDQFGWKLLLGKCLCFSSCCVGRGVHEIFEYHKTFCNAIVAPAREITWGEGLVAYSAFYHRAQNADFTVSQDIKVMNSIVGAGTFKLIESTKSSTTFTIG